MLDRRLRAWLFAGAATALAGCASFQPVPEGHAGPVAYLTDTSQVEDGSKARIFAAVEIDGRAIDNSFKATSFANQGKGFSLTPVDWLRRVPIRPMVVTLRGSHATGAPIHAIASQMAGTFYSVEGKVPFEPRDGVQYVVKGELSKQASSVWIEEKETGVVVTPKVTSP